MVVMYNSAVGYMPWRSDDHVAKPNIAGIAWYSATDTHKQGEADTRKGSPQVRCCCRHVFGPGSRRSA
jgi:hypothetical protein